MYEYTNAHSAPSFPTRRSSDLHATGGGQSGIRRLESTARISPQSPRDRRFKPANADRKSTRLNSSHGYISYTVFCMTKKTITTRLINWLHVSIPLLTHHQTYGL